MRTSPDRKKVKEFITTKLVLYEMLRVFFKKKRKRKKRLKNMNNKMALNTFLSITESKKISK